MVQIHQSLQLLAILTTQEMTIGSAVLRSEMPSAIATYGMIFIDLGKAAIAHRYATLALKGYRIL
jgi:hypothetical protein